MSQHANEFVEMDREAWIIAKLGIHGRRILDGLTNREMRKARIRTAIITAGLAHERVVAQSPETWSQLFARFYQSPFETTPEVPCPTPHP